MMSKSVFPGILFFFVKTDRVWKFPDFFDKTTFSINNRPVPVTTRSLTRLSTRFANSFTGYLRASRALSRAIYALRALYHGLFTRFSRSFTRLSTFHSSRAMIYDSLYALIFVSTRCARFDILLSTRCVRFHIWLSTRFAHFDRNF